MKASDLFIKALENEGVEYIFGIPGEENLDLLNSLKDSSIKLVLTRHEQVAGFMAATYGRLTGNPGVCLSTLGPGASNLVTAAAYAQLGGMPMLMITGQKPIKVTKQGQFQIIDVVQMMKPVTKYAKQIVDSRHIPSLVRDSFRRASEERPGAVHLELPEDIATEEVNCLLIKPQKQLHPYASDKAITQAANLINQAKMPLLLIGAGANRTRTSKALTSFINKIGIPFFNTQMGKGVVDERHPLFLGTAALSSNDFIHYAIDKADLIINVGHDIIEKPPFFMEGDSQKVIHINFFPSQIDEVYFPQLDVVGDIATSVEKLTNQIADNCSWDTTYYQKVKNEVDLHITKYFEDARFPILPQRLIKIMRDTLDSNDIVTLDNGVYKIWFSRNYQCHEPNTLLLDNALATMGAGFPSAMAAKMVYPDKKVVAVCGDGGFMMNVQDLETAVRLNLNIVIIILNDRAYGMIKWKQQGMGFDEFGLNFNDIDFVKMAESFGAIGHRPSSCQQTQQILYEALSTPGLHLIDLHVDYSLNHPVLHKLLETKPKRFI